MPTNWNEIESCLSSLSDKDQLRGWQMLQQAAVAGRLQLFPEQLVQLMVWLAGIAGIPEKSHVWKAGVTAMLAVLSFQSRPGPTAIPSGAEPLHTAIPTEPRSQTVEASLGEWLWGPFQQPSYVLAVKDPAQRARDEWAAGQLANCLPHTYAVQLQHLNPGDSSWSNQLLTGDHQAICLVGRLGLYGPLVPELWGSPELRFRFLMQERPEDLPRGELHDVYHCIEEDAGDGTKLTYRTSQNDVERRDFGLVQRYTVKHGSKIITVVAIAGASRDGTLATAMWSGELLIQNRFLILAPPNAAPDSRMEALIEVRSPLPDCHSEPFRFEVKRLFVDDARWDVDKREWEARRIKCITVVWNGEEPVDVLIDGEPAGFQANTQTIRLLAKSAKYRDADGIINEARLGADTEIWDNNKKPRTVDSVRRALSQLILRKHLHSVLFVEKGKPSRLDAEVVHVQTPSTKQAVVREATRKTTPKKKGSSQKKGSSKKKKSSRKKGGEKR